MAIMSRHTTRESDQDYQVENPDLSSYHANGDANGHHGGDSSSMVSEDDDSQHLQTIEAAMAKLHRIHNDAASWDKALKHKHGVDVYVRKDIVNLDGKDRKMPIYKGELTIDGFTPSAVFAVTAQRDLWDDWYDHGNLVADLNDRTSITYMNMKPPGTARPRDMALVERVDVAEDGSIWFCATSTESVKVPQVHGRTRAYMALSGWVLTPLQRNGQVSTQLAYYVQAEAQGLLPGALAAKMIARRPVAIYKIAEHLRKNGAPPNKAASSQQKPPSVRNGTTGAVVAAAGPERTHATNSEQAQAQALESTLPPQVEFDDTHTSAKAVKSAKRKIEEVLSDGSWQEARDTSGSAIYQIRREQGLPIVRGTAEIKGYTTEQILGTIASTSARRVWDEMFASTSLVEQVNGADQAFLVERRKGVHPHLTEQSYSLARAVFRDEPNSDNGSIKQVSTSHEGSADSNARAEYLGWTLAPSNSGDDVHVERVASTSLSDLSVPEFIERILVTAEAAQPRRLQEFLNKHGHAPFFLRWGKGKATLDEEVEGDIAQGKTSWRIGANGKEGSQVAWLQWDPKMYPKGISLTSEATIKLSRIDGTDNTAHLAFGADLPSDGFTLQAERGEGSSSGDIFGNGQKVTDSISAPQGAARQREQPAMAPTSAAVAAVPAISKGDEPASLPPQSKGAVTRMDNQIATKDGLQAQAAELTTLHRAPRLQDGTRQLPEDAMLILTRDLYFTRSQMAVVGLLMAVVFALARGG